MKKKLRSQSWFYGEQETGLLHRGALRSAGFNMDDYHGQPVIGIANTWGELNNCNMSLRTVAEHVKKGIREAGGIPIEFPVITLGEELMKPSAMLYRNLLSMDVEENIRAYPIDGVILLGNCDKTVPGLLMGAISANLPAIQLNAGPKVPGTHKGQRLGSGTDLWKYWDELRKGAIDNDEWETIGRQLSCGFGSCNTMGTASTMNGILEALGVMPLGLSTLPVDSDIRFAKSAEAGKRIVEMVYEDLRPSDICTPAAFRNAIGLCMALGGSTNAIVHLTALAGRLCIPVYPDVFNVVGQLIPCIANVQPAGKNLIDQFDHAGGMPAVLSRLLKYLDGSAITYTGKTLQSLVEKITVPANDTIVSLESPVTPVPTIAILKGNLAPRGAVIKVAAASPHLLVHTGKAVVFDDYHQMLEAVDSEDMAVNVTDILILRNAGPAGVPGMPEWGMIPIPKKLQRQGISDMVRISDSRMSGTSFGTVILHVSPEAALGSTLALVQNGDLITLDVPNRSLHLEVDAEELEKRKKQWKPPVHKHKRGYPKLYIDSVLQADEGCDFSFLKPATPEELTFIEPVVGRS
jgi:dihydroxy-acid dehydratase